MLQSSRIERRLALAIVLTALIPLLGAVGLAEIIVQRTADRFFVPEVGARLDESLGLYQELARADKAEMRERATVLAFDANLLEAARRDDTAAAQRALRVLFDRSPGLVSLSVSRGNSPLASIDRGRPVDPLREVTLEVNRYLGPRAIESLAEIDEDDPRPTLTAVFSADKARYEGLERMSAFVDLYSKISARRKQDERAYLLSFAALLGITIIGAIFAGALLARSVSRRISRLAEATQRVAAGDLSTRVDESGKDEVSDLGRAFNRMLAEVEASRARIEYLQRIGAWQEMARRLAHEIKNPLTPIQLAVEEVHERYKGEDAPFKKLLDTTFEIVRAEVGTLRRLVTEFSNFARLPQASLEAADLAQFLREQAAQASLLDEAAAEGGNEAFHVVVSFNVPDGSADAFLDRHMFRRVLINLIRNSAQAIRDTGRASGRIAVTLGRSGNFWTVDVDDDGPGIPEEQRERIFDPYVTTKEDGTGLGLAIVKKVVVEHGGIISALVSPLGGARIRLTIPVPRDKGIPPMLKVDSLAPPSSRRTREDGSP